MYSTYGNTMSLLKFTWAQDLEGKFEKKSISVDINNRAGG